MSREHVQDITLDVIERLALGVKAAELANDPRLPRDYPGAMAVFEALLLLVELADDYSTFERQVH